MRRRREDIEHTELLVGILASTVANFSMARPKNGTKPADFMPSQWGKEPPKKQRINRKRIAESVGIFLKAQLQIQK